MTRLTLIPVPGEDTPDAHALAWDERRITAALAVQLGDRLRGSHDPRDRQLLTALNRWAAGELI